LKAEIPELRLEEVEYSSESGAKLAIENGIAYPPAVFLDGKLIGKGKIDADAMVDAIRESNGALS